MDGGCWLNVKMVEVCWWLSRWVDERSHEKLNGWMDELMDGWMDE